MTVADDVRRCIKCGREVAADQAICEVCNRAGMATPSTTQYHGTVVAAIVLAIAGLAFAASLSLRGVGPYGATVREVEAAEPIGYAITYEVTNEGSRPGRAKCELVALDDDGRQLRTQRTVTGPIEGGSSLELTERIPGLTDRPANVSVSCF
jgi:hypothetical protein